MLTNLDETQSMLQDSARDFCGAQRTARKSAPGALWKDMAQLGWTGVALPAQLGGSESTPVEAGIIAYEMGRSALFTSYVETIALAVALSEMEQRGPSIDLLLRGVSSGEVELLLGQDLPPVSGTDLPGSPAPQHGESDRLVMPSGAARTFVAMAQGADGALLMLAPLSSLSTTGLPTTARRNATAVRAQVPAPACDAIVVEGPAAAKAMQRAQCVMRALYCAQLVGAARSLHEIAFDYAGIRSQFGTTISTFQAVQHALVDIFAAAEAAELLAFRALHEDCRAAVTDAATAFVRESTWTTLIKTYDVLGGVGFIEEHPISNYTRGMVPIIAQLGSAPACYERVGAGIRKAQWI